MHMDRECGACGRTVYPTEEIRCLDKVDLELLGYFLPFFGFVLHFYWFEKVFFIR